MIHGPATVAGTAARSPLRTLTFLQQMRGRHGDVFEVRLLGDEPLVLVGDPDLARRVFTAPPDVLGAGEGNRRVLGWLLGENSLILLDGERHMSHRRLLLPCFRGRRLERQAEAMREIAEAHLSAWPSEETVASLPRLRELVLEVVMRAAFGAEEDDRHGPLRKALLALLELRPARNRDDVSSATRGTIEHAERLVAAAVAARRPEHLAGERDDVLSMLLEARSPDGSSISDEEVRDELMTLVVAGTETTAGSLAWALERLSRAPEALAAVAAEAAEGGGPYTEAAIRETLRMRPAVPMSARLVARGPFQLGEHSVPEGRIVAVSALLIHHRADLYPEPMSFRPERFLKDPPGAYAWIPFGGGVRRCIGASFALMEMRIVLSALLSRMTLRAAPASEPEAMRIHANTLVPARGGLVSLGRSAVG